MCQGCKGRGIKVTIRSIGPGMVQQMQSSCNECSGEGKEFCPPPSKFPLMPFYGKKEN